MLFLAIAAAASAPHYDLHARFDAEGQLDAEVTVTLPEDVRDKSFLLSRRFTLRELQLPPGVILAAAEPSDRPVGGLYRYRFQALPSHQGPMRLGFRYSGPINYADDNGVTAFRPEGYELFIDHMWFPVGADIQTRFTLNAEFEGLAPDLVPVGQGEVTRTATGVRIRRDFLDIDVPLVAMRGLQRAEAEGVEFFAPDLTTPRATYYVRHSESAARFFQQWFGQLHHTVRMALVRRNRTMAYARTAYTVYPERGPDEEVPETGVARNAAHEVAHAWWMLASPLTDDFWLVESVAEYCAVRYIEATFGQDAAAQLLADKRRAAADAGPVMGHGRPNRIQLYQKGPLLLVELERQIGRPAMDRLLTEMGQESNHDTATFLALLTRIGGAEAARNFQQALLS